MLGLLPVVVGVLLLLGASIQEPTIFRPEGLELAWPCLLAISDTLFFLVCWNRLMLPIGRAVDFVAAAIATWLVGASVGLCLLVVIIFYGATEHLQAIVDRGADDCLRMLLLWLPIAFLSNAPWLQRRPTLIRLAALLLAYLMQASVVPARVSEVGIASLLALAACPVMVLLASSSNGTRSP